MPLSIQDRSIKQQYTQLQTKVGTNAASLDDIKGVLATIADRAGLAQTDAKTQLANAVSTQEMMSIVKEGLSARETKDIASILDAGPVKLADDARKFLEQLIGRTPVNPPTGVVNFSAMVAQANGKALLTGMTKPGVTV